MYELKKRPEPKKQEVQKKAKARPGYAGRGIGRRRVVQRKARGADTSEDTVATAVQGISGSGKPLPHLDKIQKSFGSFDVTGVKAHVGGAAAEAAGAIGAVAYATGSDVAFAAEPDLHTAAHEAAHTIHQQAGVSLKGGVGEDGDAYEQNADAVADKVVAGESAEPLLAQMVGKSADSDTAGLVSSAVQRKGPKKAKQPRGRHFFDAVGRGEILKDGYRLWNFQHASYAIDANQLRVLKTVALAVNSAKNRSKVLNIVGHASAPGTDARNLAISQARATAVETYLRSLGVAQDRFGKGKTEPVAKIDSRTKLERSAEGAARNRRVDLHLVVPPTKADPLEGVEFEKGDVGDSIKKDIPKGRDAGPGVDVASAVVQVVNAALQATVLEVIGPLMSLASIANEINAGNQRQRRAATIWGLRRGNYQALQQIELGARRVNPSALSNAVVRYYRTQPDLMRSFAHLGPKAAERVIQGAARDILPGPYNKSMAGAERRLKRHLAKMDASTLAPYLSETEQKNLTEKAARRARNKLYGEHIGRFRTKVANLVYKAIAKQIPVT